MPLMTLGMFINLGVCKAVIVCRGTPPRVSHHIRDTLVHCWDWVQFLGVAVESTDCITPCCTTPELHVSYFVVCTCLVGAGLVAYPSALSCALRSYMLPSLPFGCKLWGVTSVGGVLFCLKSPYHCDYMIPILDVLHSH